MKFFWKKPLWKKRRPFCTAIVPAAGSSTRMGGINKLTAEIGGVPVLVRTLQAIDAAQLVDEIVVAASEAQLVEIAGLCKEAGLHKPVKVIRGGATRLESVLAASAEANAKADLLAVHDGARALIRPEEFDDVVRCAQRTYAAAPAVPVTDTIKTADANGLVTGTPDRKSLYAVQTPQVFRSEILKAALQTAVRDGAEVTDDCGAVERLGKQVYLTAGSRENIKITTPLDLVVAEAILEQRGREA